MTIQWLCLILGGSDWLYIPLYPMISHQLYPTIISQHSIPAFYPTTSHYIPLYPINYVPLYQLYPVIVAKSSKVSPQLPASFSNSASVCSSSLACWRARPFWPTAWPFAEILGFLLGNTTKILWPIWKCWEIPRKSHWTWSKDHHFPHKNGHTWVYIFLGETQVCCSHP